MEDIYELLDEMAFYNGTERTVEEELGDLPQHLREPHVYEEECSY